MTLSRTAFFIVGLWTFWFKVGAATKPPGCQILEDFWHRGVARTLFVGSPTDKFPWSNGDVSTMVRLTRVTQTTTRSPKLVLTAESFSPSSADFQNAIEFAAINNEGLLPGS